MQPGIFPMSTTYGRAQQCMLTEFRGDWKMFKDVKGPPGGSQRAAWHISYSLSFLKGVHMGDYIGG